jgi:hypothetical protein
MPELPLEADHILGLHVWIGQHLPPHPHPQGGRPSVLSDDDLVTILVWNAIVLHQKTMKDIWTFGRLHLHAEFPQFPSYSAFVEHCHRVTPQMWLM